MNENIRVKQFKERHSKSGRMADFMRWWRDKVKGPTLTDQEYANIYNKI